VNSTIAAARLKLYELLVAGLAEPGRQITFGPPVRDEQNEVLALFGVLDAVEEEAELGGAHKWEDYVLELGIKVFRPEDDDETAEAVDALGFGIFDGVRGIVHGRDRNDDRTLDGALGGSGWATVRSPVTQGVRPVHGGGWVIFLRVLIRCRARVV
jgi:hypothetical protein